ncbi:hypothetical protein [Castellaniella ginsengisoli]|uniref:Uncharacterized protein n=1 Tax=Castellaniella ginsengisoli TaxID=546114 RepID=A0AB39CSU5_9BURK
MTIDTQKLLNLFDTAAQAHGWASDQGTRAQAQTALANYQRTRGDLEQALDAQAAEIARLREALWVVAEHNALHFGESHNTVIQARALLSRYSSDRPAEVRCNHCGWLGADADLVRDVAADEPDDGAADVCPQCKRIGDLQDIGQSAASAEPVGWLRNERGLAEGPATLDPLFILGKPRRDGYRATYSPVYAAPVAQEPVLGRINWPTMPSRKGQSPVLFDDGYAEGWAKCMSECQKAVAAQAQPSGDVDGLTAVYDAFGIGSAARTQETLLASIENAIRRSRCLSAIERVLTVETPPDPDEGDDEPGEECLLRWGADSEGYAEHFQAALKKFGYTLAPVAAQAQPVVPAAWKGIALDAIRRMRAGHVNCMDIIDMAEKLLEAERGAFTRAAKGE